MIDYVFILAGGSGTRLWPASTSAKPKQFFSLHGEESLLELSLKRAGALKPAGGTVIITLKEQVAALEAVLSEGRGPGDGPVFVLPEPFARNTAPALATAAVWASGHSPESSPVILVMTADHLIEPVEAFASDVMKAAELAEQGYLVTFGVPPTRPETGYGYIEAGEPVGPGRKAASFREKPDTATAEKFLEAGTFLWNSGMFCFTAGRYLEELAIHAGDVHSPLQVLLENRPPAIDKGTYQLVMSGDLVDSVYALLPSISIDYAVMEKSGRTAVVAASFSWNDIGSWDVVAELLEKETPKNAVFSAVASGNFVYSDLPVALCGVEDLIVVVRNGVVLVCKKGFSQKVKAVLTDVRKQGNDRLI